MNCLTRLHAPDSRGRSLRFAWAWALALASAPLAAADSPRSGEQVYQRVCSACHATRVEKAPQYGDRMAWKPLLEEGQPVLTAHAWVGVRGMPARGGDPSLSLDEFSRATAYMARAAGADWRDPDHAMLARIEREAEARVRMLAMENAKDPADDEHGDEEDEDDEDDQEDDKRKDGDNRKDDSGR